MKQDKERWVEIQLDKYPGFKSKFAELCDKKYTRSKRYYRKLLKDNFDINVRIKVLDGIKSIQLTEAEAIIFKLRFS